MPAYCGRCHQALRPGRQELGHNEPSKDDGERYQKYSYKKLPEVRGYIRILRLQGNGRYDAEIECKLLTVNFVNQRLEQSYEALSWCWGIAKPTGKIIILEDHTSVYRRVKDVTPDLAAALRALRYRDRARFLWIDQVCIDQDTPEEKNHQVEMMSDIYGRASKICVWLGESDPSSTMALDFIKNKVLQLQHFDELCSNEENSDKWSALLRLMQRPWFSRRWVVQEVALASSTVVYCGDDKIPWKSFAVAVELFVEVETATHRLSEVMKKDPKYYHVPGWFDHVSALGASLLVDATGKLFRDYKPNGPLKLADYPEDDSYLEPDESDNDQLLSKRSANMASMAFQPRSLEVAKPSKGQALLTLEYLVSSLSIFDVTQPHDAIYALLAIAKDTTPAAQDKTGFRRLMNKTQEMLEAHVQRKRYTVDYQKPFADVCKEFVRFCFESSNDKTRALDIICRPWAPEVQTKHKKLNGVKRKSPSDWDASAPKSKRHNKEEKAPDKNSFTIKNITRKEGTANGQKQTGGLQKKRWQGEEPDFAFPQPAWIPSLDGAPFGMFEKAGTSESKLGRKNADTLVGLPTSSLSLERNYNAAETKGLNLKTLKFAKRVNLRHWSMYVEGFILDEVVDAFEASQGGAIPRSWAKAGDWEDAPESDPPDAFWRCIVADRGRDGRNPPVYYSSACKESFAKGGLSSGSVNLTDLINNERCSIISQFCRRVQSVIWNRSLIKVLPHKPSTDTDSTGCDTSLGLAAQGIKPGDLICILFGCSVPVALRKERKSKAEVLQEMEDDLREYCRQVAARCLEQQEYRKYRKIVRGGDRLLTHFINRQMQEAWRKDPDGLDAWQEERRDAEVGDYIPNTSYFDVRLRGEEKASRIASLTGGSLQESIEDCLERRAFEKWKQNKRKQSFFRASSLQIQDRRAFDRAYRYYHRWVFRILKRGRSSTNTSAQEDQPNGPNPPYSSNGSSHSPPNDQTNADEMHTKSKAETVVKRLRVRSIAAEYQALFVKRYLAPYNPDKSIDEVKEPDWNRPDKESLAVQDKWSYYKFLGECYRHGMMDGGAMAYQNEKRIPQRTFELR